MIMKLRWIELNWNEWVCWWSKVYGLTEWMNEWNRGMIVGFLSTIHSIRFISLKFIVKLFKLMQIYYDSFLGVLNSGKHYN